MSELRLWIRDVGFPAAIAFFVLIKVDTTISKMGDKFIEAMSDTDTHLHLVITNQQRLMDSQKAILDTLRDCCKLNSSSTTLPEIEKPESRKERR